MLRLARGEVVDPRYSLAMALLDLHGQLCEDVHTLAHIGLRQAKC